MVEGRVCVTKSGELRDVNQNEVRTRNNMKLGKWKTELRLAAAKPEILEIAKLKQRKSVALPVFCCRFRDELRWYCVSPKASVIPPLDVCHFLRKSTEIHGGWFGGMAGLIPGAHRAFWLCLRGTFWKSSAGETWKR